MDMKIISKWMGVVLLASSALFTTNVMAQDLKKPTLEDLIPGGETYRFAENLYGLQWWGDTCIKPGIDSLFAVNPKTGKETLLLTREKINQALEQEKLGKLNHLHQVALPWAEKTQLLTTGKPIKSSANKPCPKKQPTKITISQVVTWLIPRIIICT